MNLRPRPMLVAFSALSAFLLSAIALSWVEALARGQGAEAERRIATALLAGAAAAALSLTRARHPSRTWAIALGVAAAMAWPVSVVHLLPGLASVSLAVVLGAILGAAVVSASRACAGASAGTGLAQVLAVSALGASAALGLCQLVGIPSLGFDGVARGAGLGAALLALPVWISGRPATDADRTLGLPPPRLWAHGLVLGSMAVLWTAALRFAWGQAGGLGAEIAASSLGLVGLAMAWATSKREADVDLGVRRALVGLGVIFVVLGPLTPRLLDLAWFGNVLVQPGAPPTLLSGVPLLMIAVVSVPVMVVSGTSLASSARTAVNDASNSGRWLAGMLVGGAVGWFFTSLLLSASSFEALWTGSGVVAAVAATWHLRGLRLAAIVGIVGVSWSGWSTRLLTSGSATEWGRNPPTPPSRVVELTHLDAQGVVALHRGQGTVEVWSSGHLQARTGPRNELALIGLHAALLSAAGPPRSALVVGVFPGAFDVLRAHGVAEIDAVVSPTLIDAAVRLPIDFDGVDLHLAEARPFLDQADRQWDVIVFGSPGPGSSAPSTVEGWRSAKRRLTVAGQLVQRLEVGDTTTASVRTTLRSMRSAFQSGASWGGAGELTLVMSDVTAMLRAERLAVRMDTPAIWRSLEALSVTGPEALLAWQVHSSEGQLRFSGPGPVSTDARPLTALAEGQGPPDVGDERLLGLHGGLELSRLARERPLTASEFRSMHRALTRHLSAGHSLVRSSAEEWLRLEPESEAAAIAFVRSATAQGDLTSAIAVMEPRLRTDQPSPELVATALHLMKARADDHSAFLQPADVQSLRELGRATLARHPAHHELRAALAALEALP